MLLPAEGSSTARWPDVEEPDRLTAVDPLLRECAEPEGLPPPGAPQQSPDAAFRPAPRARTSACRERYVHRPAAERPESTCGARKAGIGPVRIRVLDRLPGAGETTMAQRCVEWPRLRTAPAETGAPTPPVESNCTAPETAMWNRHATPATPTGNRSSATLGGARARGRGSRPGAPERANTRRSDESPF